MKTLPMPLRMSASPARISLCSPRPGAWVRRASRLLRLLFVEPPGPPFRRLRSLLALAGADLRPDDAVGTGAAAVGGDLPPPLARANASIGTAGGGPVRGRPRHPHRHARSRPAPDRPAPDFIPGRHPKILAVTTLGLLVTLIAAVTIWLIRGRADALGRSPAIAKSELQTYLRLRSDLEWLLGFLGVVVGLAYWPARSSGTSTCPMTTRRSSAPAALFCAAWFCRCW